MAAPFLTVFICFQCFWFFSYSFENKYTAEKNVAKDSLPENPFRMNKLNILWSKAKQKLGQERQSELYVKLKSFDGDLLALKKVKHSGGDADGEREADIRHRLLGVMEDYGLKEDVKPVFTMSQKESKLQHNEVTDDAIKIKDLFSDKRLNKLWKKAVKSIFSDDELQALKAEFTHHQERLDELQSLADEMEQDGNRLPNAVEDEDGNRLKKSDLKERHQNLQENFKKLSSKLETPNWKDSVDFSEQRVSQLWQLAEMANFTDRELQSLREELEHFERKVVKLKELEEMVESPKHKTDSETKTKQKQKDEYFKTKEKHKEHFRKVEKTEKDIQKRIKKKMKHIEL